MAQRVALGASKTVAIKLLSPNLAGKAEYRKMFLEEARLSMLLNNSRIVQVFDAGEQAGECYMAMEWVDGVNLTEIQTALWEQGALLPVEVSMHVIGEVLRALDYAHNLVHEGASSVVHRDVSPQNVMLSMAGEVKLMDFGVARFSTEETTGLHVKGKLRYMPAEQLQGNSRDPAVDVYAVGAVLHEMLDGRKFRHAATDDGQMLGMIFTGEIPPLRDPSAVSPALEALRRGMLTSDPRQRVTSARAALKMLEHCPNYRNASMELETLVRNWRTVATGDASLAQGHRTGSFMHVPMVERETKDTSVSRRLQAGNNPPTGTDHSRAGPAEFSRVQKLTAAIVFAVVGLGMGGMGVGIAAHGLLAQSDDPPEEANLARMEWVPAIEPRILDTPVPITGVEEPESKAEPELEPDPPEPEPDPPNLAEPPPKPRKSATPKPPKPEPSEPPVKVTIAAGEFSFLYLKIGPRTYMLDPVAKTDIVPGKRTLRFRENDKAKWQSVSVEIPKRPCRLVFKKPKTVQITFQ